MLLMSFQLLFHKEPVPIKIGEETCAYCSMKIVDLRFNAQVITEKGKIKHYDSLECMVSHEHDEHDLKNKIFVKNFFQKDQYISGKRHIICILKN